MDNIKILYTDFESRNEQIKKLINLGDENKYKKSLLEVVNQYSANQIDENTAYQAINEILADYYFTVIMPTEDQELKKRREQVQNSSIAIVNLDDTTEVAIKQNLQVNQIFNNGLSELISCIGVANLNLHNNSGELISSLNELSGGKQRQRVKDILNQYLLFGNRPDIKRYALQIFDIYEVPMLTVFDGRGLQTTGFYINRLLPLISEKIIDNSGAEYVIKTNVSRLAENIGLIKCEYTQLKRLPENESLEKISSSIGIDDIKPYMVRYFFNSTNQELRRIIFSVLDKLQNEYSVISYAQNFLIVDESGEKHTSTDLETSQIRYAQSEILEEFGVNSLNIIFLKRQSNRFFQRVIEFINNKYGYSWTNYYNQITIQVENLPKLKKLYEKSLLDDIKRNQYLSESKDKLSKRLSHKAESNYRTQNKKYADFIESNIESLEQNQDITELKNLDLISDNDILKMAKKGTKPFKYPDNYIQIENRLIEYFIGGKLE